MGVEKPSALWYNHFRKRAERRQFYVAFGVATAFHVSMVTVFSIVIYFPREDIQFRNLAIIPVEVHQTAAVPAGPTPEIGGAGATGGQLALRGAGGADSFPDIELPTLEFAELERLRVRQESLQSVSREEDLFQEPAADSWARFSRSLAGLGRSLSGLRLSAEGPDEDVPLSLDEPVAPRPVHEPAEGFQAYIVWSGTLTERKLLFAPPVEALWNSDPASLRRPIEVVLQVNALGRVVNVFSPNLDDRELVDAVQLSALQYRFEPLPLEDGAMQTATLRIEGARLGRAP